MSFKPSFRTRVLLGDFNLSCKLTQATIGKTVDMLDQTVICDEARRFLPGTEGAELSLEGFIDLATATDSAAWTAAQPFTYAAEGLAVGSPVILANALRSSYELGSAVAAVSSFSISGTVDGLADLGVSLHDLAAETADGSASVHDGGAATSNGGVASLHVTDYSGLTSAGITVEDSANGSTGWAAIATFASVTAVGAERVEITGAVRRYLRATVDVTGTGSVTYQVSFARR